MTFMHKDLAAGRWQQFTLATQMANIGSEVERAINWKNKGDAESAWHAVVRMLELIDLTIADPKNRRRLKEVVRAREMLVDYLVYDNIYHSTDEQWKNYFYFFTLLSNRQRAEARKARKES